MLYFGFSFQYNLVTIGVLEFVVVIDVYAQPAREKIKFYRTASNKAVVAGVRKESIAPLQSTMLSTGRYPNELTMVSARAGEDQ